MTDKPKTIRDTDEEARIQARFLMRGSRFGAIAAIDPQTGYPHCSRVLLGTDNSGTPAILVSRLAAHTVALLSDPRASLLVGEPGKGDPLAWPRLSLRCNARPVSRESAEDSALRTRFIRRHKKAALYAGFPDFLFLRLEPLSASLNGGFGKAYILSSQDLAIDSPIVAEAAQLEDGIISRLNSGWRQQSQNCEQLKPFANWEICALDPEGLDLKKGDSLRRLAFSTPLRTAEDLEQIEAHVFSGRMRH